MKTLTIVGVIGFLIAALDNMFFIESSWQKLELHWWGWVAAVPGLFTLAFAVVYIFGYGFIYKTIKGWFTK